MQWYSFEALSPPDGSVIVTVVVKHVMDVGKVNEAYDKRFERYNLTP